MRETPNVTDLDEEDLDLSEELDESDKLDESFEYTMLLLEMKLEIGAPK